ncbi:MAG: hypothetical protein VKI82_03715 [Leptolyngbya sp.]|nr:hypothetical protein [Leptolyngbya sp.]
MLTSLEIHCPNCGRLAQRHFDDEETACQGCSDPRVAKTECPHCDYLLTMCWGNGRVLEAYAPGTVGEVKRPSVFAPTYRPTPTYSLSHVLTGMVK